jgi:3-methyladenine DNA glycosylase AlkD
MVAKQSEIVAAITREFKAAADPKYRESIQRFFKEPVKLHGVRTAEFRRIAGYYLAQVRTRPKSEVLKLCEELLAVRNGEERSTAFQWAWGIRRQLGPADFPRLERWLKQHVSNWGSCDSLCTGVLGTLLLDHPEFLPKVKAWAKSKNRWLRRAAAVALIPAGKQEKHLPEAYATADALLLDEDDMVQKGYGWMLKEISNKRPREVFEFVMKRKAKMPRTALRYAIEKLPPAWRKRAMAR